MVSIFYFLLLVYFNCISCLGKNSSNNNNENRDLFYSNELNENKSQKEEFKRNLEEEYKPIRIYVDTSYLKYQFENNMEEFYEIEKSIEIAKNTIEKLIKVKPLNYKIFINEDINGFNKNRMNLTVFSEGISDDLLIFVRLPSTGQEDDLITNEELFAIPKIIKSDSASNRPIAGYIIFGYNYNVKRIRTNTNKDQRIELRSSIFLHEMIHILGFMDSHFQYFNNYDQIFGTKEVNRVNLANKNKKIVKSQRILDIATKYFNCPTIEGIELENQENAENLTYSHWEARILLGDIMTSDIYFQEQIISEFTLALLEDSGWYKANYYTGGLMKFGMHKGCEFINNDCIVDNQYNIFSNDFCSLYQNVVISKGTCSIGRISRGYCGNRFLNNEDEYNEYTRYIQKFDAKYDFYGLKNVEYCPVSNQYINRVSYNYNGNCHLGNNDFGDEISFINGNSYKYSIFSDTIGQKYEQNSFCALSSVIHVNEEQDKKQIYEHQIRPTCYPMFCSDKSLTILINDLYVVCPRKGNAIYVDGYNYIGYILCPNYNSICTGTKLCNNMFDCVEKESKIKDEDYTYDDSNGNVVNDVTSRTYRDDNVDWAYKSMVTIGYELSENSLICPKDCIKCYKNRRCIECRKYEGKEPYYLGIDESITDGPLNCSEYPPTEGYYKSPSNPRYYYKCLPNCLKCNNPNECLKCELTHYIDGNKKCKERIPGCKDYNKDIVIYDNPCNGDDCSGYKECLNCNNLENYYCIDQIKTECKELNDYNNKTYYNIEDKEFPCIGRCSEKFLNCKECERSKCVKCIENNYFVNINGNCIKNITHCLEQREDVDYSECSKCENDFNCIGVQKSECIKVDNMKYYHPIVNSNCIERCSKTYDNCLECNNEQKCTKCNEGYFVHNGECMENITGCINNYYDGTKKGCNECDGNKGYFCINQTKEECYKLNIYSLLPRYYLVSNINYPCYNPCDTLVRHCLTCDSEKCIECDKQFIVNDNGDKCLVKPFDIPDNDNCSLNFLETNKTIFEIDPWDLADNYWLNIPYTKIIDHYVGGNYTSTVFLHPECTEGLLSHGYYKINSTDLQNLLIKGAKIEGMKLLFSVYTKYNYKSNLKFYNIELNHINPYNYCLSCLETDYFLINNFSEPLKDILGPVVQNLISAEKIGIFDKDSDMYNDICQNVTFFGIDMPLKKRLHYLYFHKYLEQILCNSENCTIEENNYDDLTTTCKCRIGNFFEDIFKGDKFQFIPYEEETKSNDFIDSLSIIKCTINGFKSKNIISNIGFFICVVAIAGQVGLYIYYSLCNKPIKNINKNINSNPPKKTALVIMTDWEKNVKDYKDGIENEIYVQPRDDAEDQLLEEEKSYDNEGNFFDTSSLSIDTNVGGVIKNISTGNKMNIKEKANQRKVLILLNNKNKNNNEEDLISDNDIGPLSADEKKRGEHLDFGRIYWYVLSLKQHIINYFSTIDCCKMTESYIPIAIRLIRSIFMIILSFVINALCFNQSYYDTKFEHFNERYKFIFAEKDDIDVPVSQRIIYAISNGFGKAMLTLLILLIVQLILGVTVFSVRNKVIKAKRKKSREEINNLISKVKLKYLIFFIVNLALMIIFLFTLAGFCGAYGGGFVDYFTASIITLIFFEIFPFIWSIAIALFRYFGIKKNKPWCIKISEFFMF